MEIDPGTMQKLVVEAVRRHNVLPMTGLCNLSCCFCSHVQNPPGTRAYTFPPVETECLLDLLPFLDPNRKIIVGESATRLREGEPLTHPDFFTVLKMLRRRFPGTLLQVTTNGSLLDRLNIRRLSSLRPLELVLSLNSATENGRRLLMNDPRPASTVSAVQELVKVEIPFHGSVVAMPHLTGWDDLNYTLMFLDSAGAKTVRLLLPGFTRLSRPALFPPPETPERLRDLAELLRKNFRAPLLLEPPLIDDFNPRIEGFFAGSPAAIAGLKTGDLILSVNGFTPVSRVDAYIQAQKSENPSITVFRNGGRLQVHLKKKRFESPGFSVSRDLDPEQLERIRRNLSPGKETLMLLSTAAYPHWQLARERFQLEGLRLAAVESRFFGGNIACAGLLTVSDFAFALEKERSLPERILIPAAAFDPGGLDLQGRHYSILSRPGTKLILVE